MNLRTTRSVVWVDPPSRDDAERLLEWEGAPPARRGELETELAPARQVRATVTTLNALQHSRYLALLRQARSWIDQEAPGADEMTKMEYLDVCIKWAAVLASVARLEQRYVQRTAVDNDHGWQEMELPQEWRSPAGWLENVPAELAAAVYAQVMEINPGLFGWGAEDFFVQRMRGGVSVG